MSRVDDMPGYLAALACTAIMALTAWWLDVVPLTMTDAAICIRDWPAWIPGSFMMTLAGFLLLWIVSVITTRVNRRFNVEEGTSALPSSFFLMATAAVPGLVAGLSPAVMMALVTILALLWMFGCIDREQKAQPMFLAGTAVAFGSTVEYSFIPLAIAIACAAGSLGILSVRSVTGYIFGLITPYILLMGFMLVPLSDISVPDIYTLPVFDSWPAVVATGITSLIAVLLMLREAVTPSNRSSRSLALNRAINIVLMIMIAAMAVDFHNFAAYIPTVALLTGFSVAGVTGIRSNTRTPSLLTAIIMIVYIILFIIAV